MAKQGRGSQILNDSFLKSQMSTMTSAWQGSAAVDDVRAPVGLCATCVEMQLNLITGRI